MSHLERLREAVRSVPDFPKPGITFRDLTPILADPVLLDLCFEEHLRAIEDLVPTRHVWKGQSDEDPIKHLLPPTPYIDVVVGMESRGFWFGPGIARSLKAGFVPARKPGKLPGEVVEAEYGLEYGKDHIQIHTDAIKPGMKVLIVDDLLATGGTAAAVGDLVKGLGGETVAYLFAIELDALGGHEKLGDVRIESLLHF